MEIYLIRHTAVDVEPGVCYGQTDVPLAASFKAEADAVRKKLPRFDGLTVYSSPLSRCQKLAERLCSSSIRLDQRLMEMHFGVWEQQRWDDIAEDILKAWMSDFVNQQCSGGESYQDVFQRTVAFWKDLCQQNESDILVITHAGVIRALLAHLLDMPLKNVMYIGIDFGSISKIRRVKDGFFIEYINK